MTPHRDIWVATGEGRLFARRWGGEAHDGRDRAPIVLFHDSLGCVDLWRRFPAHLAEATGRDVIAYDRLGFGRSDPHPGRLPLDFVRAEARGGFAALRDRLGIGDFVGLGHSVGGGMAVAAAGALPAKCVALVTLSAQAFIEDRTLDGIREAKRGFEQPGQLDRLRRYHGDKARWVLDAWTGTWLSPTFRGWTLDDDLPLVRCPALAIHGADDEYGSASQPRRIAALATGPAGVEILPACGHVPHREQPETVIDLVRAFLDRTV